ncbi:FMN-binding protein MioC [Shewanella surugensis]|uniref:FMN-binding protein MioC n=1 Tax=Shewanella surugensis TaxID=212020 RepID=A0ABT0LBB3_9GAMM|nr:FMN-binding protein MioC [Shewanella surugensis]MCL1124647.1 FMN-binding protein MioC [Shewanella surugensis]
MSKIDIIVGTTLGNAEYVADEIASELTALGHEIQLHLTPNRTELTQDSLWFIVSSTHGAGDLPDNIQPFFNEIEQNQPDLSHKKFIICAIGDSSYDTFCHGPTKLECLLEHCSAKACVDKIEIDVQRDPIPEKAALSWILKRQDRL